MNCRVGWDAELYRNGQLLAFAENRADGRYEFIDVPLLYGQNRFEVVLYGPQGQITARCEVGPCWPGLDPAQENLLLGYDSGGRRGSDTFQPV